MNSTNPSLQIFGTAKILRSRLISIYSQRESENIVRMLVLSIAGLPYHRIVMEPSLSFSPHQFLEWQMASERLILREPIQYVIGTADFLGLELLVKPGVLIPRPETEELTSWIEAELREMDSPSILDIGTGSGCIPVYLKVQLPKAKVQAIDVSSDALEVARRNASLYKVQIEFLEMDVLKASGSEYEGLQVLVSNPPYIPQSEQAQMEAHVLSHEPDQALFVPDETPLLFYDKISDLGLSYLSPGGRLYFEIHELFADEVVELLEQKDYSDIEIRCDLQEKPRMVKAVKASENPS